MKKYILSSIVGCLLISSFAPLGAQNRASSWRQKASRAWAKIPSPSLPSWAKGPGFEAAKKWYRDGYSTKNLSKAEKKAFNRLKKKIAIGSIISALLITFGVRTGVRQYQQAKIDKILQTAFTKVQRYAIDTAMAGNISEINQLLQENPELYLVIPLGATLAGNKLLADQLLSKAKEEDKADIAENIALGAVLTGNKQRAYEMINLPDPNIDKQEIAESIAWRAVTVGNVALAYEMLSLPYVNKQRIAGYIAVGATTVGNDALAYEMLSLPDVNKKEIATEIAYQAATVGNDALVQEMLSLPDVNKQEIAERIAYNAATVGNDALVKKMLDLEGIDRNSIQESLDERGLWKESYNQ